MVPVLREFNLSIVDGQFFLSDVKKWVDDLCQYFHFSFHFKLNLLCVGLHVVENLFNEAIGHKVLLLRWLTTKWLVNCNFLLVVTFIFCYADCNANRRSLPCDFLSFSFFYFDFIQLLWVILRLRWILSRSECNSWLLFDFSWWFHAAYWHFNVCKWGRASLLCKGNLCTSPWLARRLRLIECSFIWFRWDTVS